ncbi:hypothetical protein B0T10DRAFT_464302 [Thelonectria olida]|uniref:Uncharacterized protein n=1 Tax=Thelonectria olida TaxID=1576542 RepID=A0A9P9AH72_9HYPO|nr:hypothetical protein B0T10DRAFT_464302 [Thelonectria olida]
MLSIRSIADHGAAPPYCRGSPHQDYPQHPNIGLRSRAEFHHVGNAPRGTARDSGRTFPRYMSPYANASELSGPALYGNGPSQVFGYSQHGMPLRAHPSSSVTNHSSKSPQNQAPHGGGSYGAQNAHHFWAGAANHAAHRPYVLPSTLGQSVLPMKAPYHAAFTASDRNSSPCQTKTDTTANQGSAGEKLPSLEGNNHHRPAPKGFPKDASRAIKGGPKSSKGIEKRRRSVRGSLKCTRRQAIGSTPSLPRLLPEKVQLPPIRSVVNPFPPTRQSEPMQNRLWTKVPTRAGTNPKHFTTSALKGSGL